MTELNIHNVKQNKVKFEAVKLEQCSETSGCDF